MKVRSVIEGALLAFVLAVAFGPAQAAQTRGVLEAHRQGARAGIPEALWPWPSSSHAEAQKSLGWGYGPIAGDLTPSASAQPDFGALSRNLRLRHDAPARPCAAITGTWRWFTGGVVTINPNGTMVYAGANDGVWSCTDPSRNTATLKWRLGGFVNKMILSADGKSLSSTDMSQAYVRASRIGEGPRNEAAKHPPAVAPKVAPAVVPQRSPSVTPQASPTTHGYSADQAIVLERRHDWKGLVAYGKAWTRVEPKNAVAWAVISVGYAKLGRPDLALKPGEHSVALDRRNPHAWLGLGVNYFQLHRYADAANAFSRSIALDSHNPTAWNDLAVAYSYEPESNCRSDTHTTVAICGRPRMLLQLLEKQERIAGPYQDYAAWYNLGNAFKTVGMQFENNRFQGTAGAAHQLMLLELKAFIKARDAYRKALKLNSGYAFAWNNLGVVESKIGHWQAALGYYQHAASLGDPLSSDNYKELKKYIAYEKQLQCIYTRVSQGDGWYRLYPSMCLPRSAFNRSGSIAIPR